ncbi:phage portal protein [Bacillota bacterium Meth-B3]
MGWIDNAIAAISPKWSYERAAWRIAADEMRNYDAGKSDRINSGWRVGNQAASMTDGPYRDIIRARARDMERNSDMLGAILRTMERNVVGWGLQLQPHTGDDNLDDQVDELFCEWRKARNCDVTGMQTFDEICQMIVRRKVVDGAIVIVKRYIHGRKVPFCLQLLEVDELCGDVLCAPGSNNRVEGGVEVNRWNQPVAYWVREYAGDGLTPIKPVRLPAQDVIYYYHKTRPSQIREMSELTATIPRLRDSEEFIEAVSVKERIAACLAVFIKRALPTGGYGRSGTMRPLRDKPSGYDGKRITPGMIEELSPGDEIQSVQPPGQGQGAADMIRMQQRLAGAGLGLGYETVSRDMSQVNYSSARQGLIEDDMTYKMEQQSLIDHVLTEIYETFFISAVLSGALVIPGFWDEKRKYLNHEWVAQGKAWIDPLKEASANLVAMKSGQKTFREIAGAAGYDWREMLVQIAEERAFMTELGLEALFTQPQKNTKNDENEGDKNANQETGK